MRVYALNDPRPAPTPRSRRCGSTATCTATRCRAARRSLYLAWYLLENNGHERARDGARRRGSRSTCCRRSTPTAARTGSREANDANSLALRACSRPTTTATACSTRTRRTTSTATATSCRCASTCRARATTAWTPTTRACIERVPANDRGIRGDWILLGEEGIDNDGDGRINEDGLGGYDMNRAWPSMWKPELRAVRRRALPAVLARDARDRALPARAPEHRRGAVASTTPAA